MKRLDTVIASADPVVAEVRGVILAGRKPEEFAYLAKAAGPRARPHRVACRGREAPRGGGGMTRSRGLARRTRPGGSNAPPGRASRF